MLDRARLDASEFTQLAEELFGADTPKETAERVVVLARAELDVDLASITMIRPGGRLETAAATDLVAIDTDKLQEELAEGPCVDTSWRRQTLLSRDLRADSRWPSWGPRVADLGVNCLLAVELRTGVSRAGMLSLFSKRQRDFSDDDVAFAHIFARHAALALQTAENDANLMVALDGRKLIGQAQGILMERCGVDDTRAFAILKRYSQDHNIKLGQVAAELVATRRLPDGEHNDQTRSVPR